MLLERCNILFPSPDSKRSHKYRPSCAPSSKISAHLWSVVMVSSFHSSSTNRTARNEASCNAQVFLSNLGRITDKISKVLVTNSKSLPNDCPIISTSLQAPFSIWERDGMFSAKNRKSRVIPFNLTHFPYLYCAKNKCKMCRHMCHEAQHHKRVQQAAHGIKVYWYKYVKRNPF